MRCHSKHEAPSAVTRQSDRLAFKDILIPHIEETNAKDGALFYTFAQDVRDDSVSHILEGWTDKKDLDRHNASPAFQETLKKVASRVRLLGRDANVYTIASQEPVASPGNA